MSVMIDGSPWVLVSDGSEIEIVVERHDEFILISDGAAYEILQELESRELVEILVPGVQGPPGPPGVGVNSVLTANFAYGDATPAELTTVPAGKHAYTVRLFVEDPFNGIGASLSVGSSGSPQELLSSTENNPAQVGTYLVHPDKKYLAATPIFLTIVPGAGASAGSGQLQIDIEP